MFKIKGYRYGEVNPLVDCSYKRIKGNNYINTCTEGNILDEIELQVVLKGKDDIDRIIDMLQSTKLCFI